MKNLLFTLLSLALFCYSKAQNHISIHQSNCNPSNSDAFELKERIIKQDTINDSLVIVLGKREICCATFSANYTVENDTLKIEYENEGEECFCTCFYELTFTIDIQDLSFNSVVFNGYSFDQNDEETVEYTSTIDTLDNGAILRKKYEGNELVLEIEVLDSIRIYRRFYKGELIQERRQNTSNK